MAKIRSPQSTGSDGQCCPTDQSDASLRRFVQSDGNLARNVVAPLCYEPRSLILTKILATTRYTGENIADVASAAPGAITSESPLPVNTGLGILFEYPGFVEEHNYNFTGAENVNHSFTYLTTKGQTTNDTARVTVRSGVAAMGCAIQCDSTFSLYGLTGRVIANRFYHAGAIINQNQQIAPLVGDVQEAHTLVDTATFGAGLFNLTQRVPTPEQNQGLYQVWFQVFFGIDLDTRSAEGDAAATARVGVR
jgi:hypothetical protein